MEVVYLVFSLILLSWTPGVCGYRVLLIVAPAGGHFGPFVGLAEELDKQGHEVFTLTAVNENIPVPAALNVPPNRTMLKLEMGEEALSENSPDQILEEVVKHPVHTKQLHDKMVHFLLLFQKNMLMENEKLMTRLEDMNFDVAIVDDFFLMRFFYLVPHRLGIPTISVILVVESFNLRVPQPPSFVPSFFTDKTDKMTFYERLENAIAIVFFHYFMKGPPLTKEIKEKYLEYGSFESVDELTRRPLLWLHIVDPVLDLPSPSVPSIVKVGALSASATLQPLEGSIRDFVEGSHRGLILMTFGSSVTHLPEDKAQKFIDAFRQMKERVIWKFENKDNLDIPQNVLLSSWLPQKELLDHSSTRLFITHCGSGGQHEAVTYGVPMIAFPLFGDQFYNAARGQRHGYSITMDIHSFTSEELLANMRRILDDSGFRQRTQKAAEIIKERRQSPAELAVYWIDHVMKHGGYLRHQALDMDLYQVVMVDIFLFLAFCVFIIIFVAFCCLRCLIRRCRKVKLD